MTGRLRAAIAVAILVLASCASASEADSASSSEAVAVTGSAAQASTVRPTTTPTATVIPPPPPSATIVPTVAETRLLPAEADWVMVNQFGAPTDDSENTASPSTPARHKGTWVWSVDGQLVMLHAGTRFEVERVESPQAASIRTSHNRSTLVWTPADDQIALIAFGIDDSPLTELAMRDMANQLEFARDTWTLPAATLILEEPAGVAPSSDRRRVDLAPTGPDGSADLGVTVINSSEVASPGAMYRALIGWSNLGDVSQFTIEGHDGVLVTGTGEPNTLEPQGSWAAIAIDGHLFSWSTTFRGAADNDQLAALLGSTQIVSEAAWQEAVDNRAAEVTKAVEAEGVDPESLAAPADLPRYLLPDGWSIEWVTDKGIWSAEQRAREVAGIEAARPAGLRAGWPVATRTQGFGFADSANRANELVLAVIVNTSVFGDGFDIPQQPTNYTPIEVGGLVGSAAGGGAELYAENIGVFMRGSTLDESELLDFVQALRPRNDDPAQGFTVADDRYVQEFEITGDEQPGEAARRPISKWAMYWHHDDSSAEAGITARIISPTDLRQRLTYAHGAGSGPEQITGGFDDPVITGESISGTSFWHYDTQAELLIEVGVNKSNLQARDLFNSLIPIDLQAWTDLAAPLNAKPR